MKAVLKLSLVVVLNLFFTNTYAQYASVSRYKVSTSKKLKVDFTEWSSLLRRNTSVNGTINYSGFKLDKNQFEKVVRKLSNTIITNNWTQDERKAYWINVYNTFSVKLIMDNFPVKSITDLDKPFKNEFFEINREMMSLNDVEKIIASFNDPRLLLVLNRNSITGIRLIKKAYTASNLDEMLDKRIRLFINNPEKNKITEKVAELSPLFKIYSKEFLKAKISLKGFINGYNEGVFWENQRVVYKDYERKINSYQAYGN